MKITGRSLALMAMTAAVCTAPSISSLKCNAQTVGQCDTVKVIKTKAATVVPAATVPLTPAPVITGAPEPVVPTAVTAAAPACNASLVDTRTDENTIYTPVTNGVMTPIAPCPAVAAPIDTIKLQIANRMNGGLLSGKLTDPEADEVRSLLDNVSLEENNLKLLYGDVNTAMVGNLMPKYHMINQRLDDLLNNTNTADYMLNVENRRAGLQTSIGYHVAAGNITPGEGEQLLAALNAVSEEYNSFRATGGTVTGDELEQVHTDLFKVRKKLAARCAAPLMLPCPEVLVHEQKLLKTIQDGLACDTLTDAEGHKLLCEYERLVTLRKSIAADDGYNSPDMLKLIAQIDDMNFILGREIHDRQLAGSSTHY